MTINSLLVLMKTVRARRNELVALRSDVGNKKTFYGQAESTVEPQYDIKKVDKKIVEMENFLFKADSAIKQSNAKIEVEIEINVDSLLAPLE